MSDIKDIMVTHATNAIECSDIVYHFFNEVDKFMTEVIPCTFYNGEPKELAIAKKENNITTILIATIADYDVKIEDEVKRTIDKTLQDGDRVVFNFVTGDIILKNGDKQVKCFDLYPYNAIRDLPKKKNATICAFSYVNKKGDDCIGYSYISTEEKPSLLYALSALYRKRLSIKKDVHPTAFGLTLACNLVQEDMKFKTYGVTEKTSSRFIMPESSEIVPLANYNALKELGGRVGKQINMEFMNLLSNDVTYDKHSYNRYGPSRFPIIKAETTHSVVSNPIITGEIIPNIPPALPLSQVLRKMLTIIKYPRDLIIDIVLTPYIKKVIWVGPDSLLIYVTDMTRAMSDDVIKIFEQFDTQFMEMVQ